MNSMSVTYFCKAQPYNRAACPALAVAVLLKGHDGQPEYPGLGAGLFTLLGDTVLDNTDLPKTMLTLALTTGCKLEMGRGTQVRCDVEMWGAETFADAQSAGAKFIYVVSPARTDTTKLHLKVYEIGAKIVRIYSGRLDSYLSHQNRRSTKEMDRVAA